MKTNAMDQNTIGYVAIGIDNDFVGSTIAIFALVKHNSNKQNRRIRHKSSQHGYGE
jgi:hypothetical protein